MIITLSYVYYRVLTLCVAIVKLCIRIVMTSHKNIYILTGSGLKIFKDLVLYIQLLFGINITLTYTYFISIFFLSKVQENHLPNHP